MAALSQGAQRERVMLVTLVNHPLLIAEFLEELAAMSFADAGHERLRAALVEAGAEVAEVGREQMEAELAARGLGEVIARLRRRGFGTGPVAESFARPEAHEAEARRGFRHLAQRDRRAALEADIEAAQRALAERMTEEALAHLAALRHQLQLLDRGQEEGSGAPAGAGLASPRPGTT